MTATTLIASRSCGLLLLLLLLLAGGHDHRRPGHAHHPPGLGLVPEVAVRDVPETQRDAACTSERKTSSPSSSTSSTAPRAQGAPAAAPGPARRDDPGA